MTVKSWCRTRRWGVVGLAVAVAAGVMGSVLAPGPQRADALPAPAAPLLEKVMLTVSSSNGTVSGGGLSCSGVCTLPVEKGTVLTLRARPHSGFLFLGWGGACSGTGSTCTLTMDRDRSVSARFGRPTLTVTVVGGGRVEGPGGLDCTGHCTVSYAAGQVVSLTARPFGRTEFVGWGGSCSGFSCTLTMNGNKSVVAVFEPDCGPEAC